MLHRGQGMADEKSVQGQIWKISLHFDRLFYIFMRKLLFFTMNWGQAESVSFRFVARSFRIFLS